MNITTAQMTALASRGLFEVCDDFDSEALKTVRAAITGDTIEASDTVADALNELSNEADELGDEATSKVFYNFCVKIRRAL